MSVTEKDEELIALLQTNARMPVSELARRLGVSRTTIQDRLRRLEVSGVITGYGVRLANQTTADGILAHVELSVEPRMNAQVVRALMRLPQVETLHTVSGKFDLIAQIRARTTDHIDMVLDQIGVIEGVTRTESAIILSTKMDRR
ncbi:MAG: Lrp/AsnC family transcriptional regulator [Anderseniella sp.]